MQKARGERSVYLELVIEFPQRKTYKLLDGGRGDSQQPHHHFHYENRLTCLQQNLLVRGCYYIRNTFLLDIP